MSKSQTKPNQKKRLKMPSARTECVLNVSGAPPRPKAPREECIPTPGKERSQTEVRPREGRARGTTEPGRKVLTQLTEGTSSRGSSVPPEPQAPPSGRGCAPGCCSSCDARKEVLFPQLPAPAQPPSPHEAPGDRT